MGKINYSDVPLTFLKNDERASVAAIKTDDMLKLRKLTAFGIMPGSDIAMIQRYPAFVVQVGFTQVALDEEIASLIIVNKKL